MAEDHIYVRSAGPALKERRVALWERHPKHPHNPDEVEGEVFVPAKDNAPVKVGETSRVGKALLAGDIVKVEAPKKEGPPPDAASSVAEEKAGDKKEDKPPKPS
jgi:hypothetical protein